MDQHPDCIVHAARWRAPLAGLAWTALGLGGAAALLALAWPAIGYAGFGLERTWLGLAAGAAWAVAAAAFPALLIVTRRTEVAAAAVRGSAGPERRASSPTEAAAAPAQPPAAADQTAPSAPAAPTAKPPPPPPDPVADLLVAAGWPQLLRLAPWAALAGAVALVTWTPAGGARLAVGIAALIAAFPALLAERRFAHAPAAQLPEAAGLARLLRVAVAVGAGGGTALVLIALGIALAHWLLVGLLALVVLAAGELVLRGLAAPFLPVGAPGEARGVGDSLAAGALFQRQPPWRLLGDGLRRRFGIDLAQSWAFAFLARAALPLAALVALLAWLSTGITALAIDQRGVYERFGAPAAVLPSGLHLHLPWPLGAVRRVDNGAVHLLALSDDGDKPPPPAAAPLEIAAAPGPEWDRLWENKHGRDAVHLVPAPAEGGGRAGHHVINADVRVSWRWRLDDAGALAACYAVAAPRDLVAARASRLLGGEFARLPVARLIAGDREELARRLAGELQAGLDADRAGIEVLAVLIDAIHPPAEAAGSYHRVQAAEILAEAEVARARSEQAALAADAGREATVVRDNAHAGGAETQSRARVDARRFGADAAAHAAGGRAWLLERWLQTLARSGPSGRFLIIDHRLDTDVKPTVDLRRFVAPTATSTD